MPLNGSRAPQYFAAAGVSRAVLFGTLSAPPRAMPKKTTKNKLEGEGSYTGTRQYNSHLAEYESTTDVADAARKAAKALDSKEGADLRKAEARAKQGPTRKSQPRPARSASPHR